MAEATNKEPQYTGVGRRKTSTARVRLTAGKEGFVVNDKPIEEYFYGKIRATTYQKPFKVTNTINKFAGSVRVNGGGLESQLDAVTHAISRALLKFDPTFKVQLRKHKLLTRDSRMKESLKYGNAHAARAKKSSPKR